MGDSSTCDKEKQVLYEMERKLLIAPFNLLLYITKISCCNCLTNDVNVSQGNVILYQV